MASPLDEITHLTWVSGFDDDLLDILNVLTLLVDFEPEQADLLEAICDGPLLTREKLEQTEALRTEELNKQTKPKVAKPRKGQMAGEQQLSGD